FPRNPWAFGGGVPPPSFATHAGIRTRPRSTTVHTAASQQRSTLPYPSRIKRYDAASALYLSPVTLSATDHSTSELLRTLSRVAACKARSWLAGESDMVWELGQNLGL